MALSSPGGPVTPIRTIRAMAREVGMLEAIMRHAVKKARCMSRASAEICVLPDHLKAARLAKVEGSYQF